LRIDQFWLTALIGLVSLAVIFRWKVSHLLSLQRAL